MFLDKILKSKVWPAAWGGFSRTFIMLGLPLLAWGIEDLAGFFSNPIRTGIAALAIIQAILMAWMVYQMPDRPHQAHDPEHWHYSLSELVFILSAFGDRRSVLTWAENPTLRWVGLGLYLLAALYSVWANLTWLNHLRHKAEHACDNPVLLTEGPFKWTRYPTLLGLFFYSLGFVLAFRSWIGLVFLIPLAGIIFRRINLWDQMYANRYKHIWVLRSQTSKRLIPLLY
jgi:protein-S-isoprenylcysteine O-methyltransferase Ste14